MVDRAKRALVREQKEEKEENCADRERRQGNSSQKALGKQRRHGFNSLRAERGRQGHQSPPGVQTGSGLASADFKDMSPRGKLTHYVKDRNQEDKKPIWSLKKGPIIYKG